MTIQDKLISKYGDPTGDIKVFESRSMTLWDIPLYINTHIPALPNKIFCNKDMVRPLTMVLNELISIGYYREIKTYDGCYNVRYIRGSRKALSIHSWGLAIDLNAAHNPLGLSKTAARNKGLVPFSDAFDEVWRDHGFTAGIDFARMDGMHFEYINV
jgi:hypothetical protein